MIFALIHCHVKPEQVEAFKAAITENARNSIREPGILRFDVLQQDDDPTRFVLYEVYRSQEAVASHRETAHFKKWRATTENMFVEPRTPVKYQIMFPAEGELE